MIINHISLERFIKEHIRYQQHWNTKVVDMRRAKWQELSEDIWMDGSSYAKGSKFKVFETQNFGWIVFDKDTKTVEGNVPNRRILKF